MLESVNTRRELMGLAFLKLGEDFPIANWMALALERGCGVDLLSQCLCCMRQKSCAGFAKKKKNCSQCAPP